MGLHNSTSQIDAIDTKISDRLSTGSKNKFSAPFVWGAGIECSFIPHLNVDQFDWTQHNRFWREDLKAAREKLGITHLRYALPWHRIEPQRGQFDWSATDERIAFCKELGIELYLDVMHFGMPMWLRQAAGDPEFPESLEAFTEAIVERYRDMVRNWCPCNEPLVLGLFSGDFGFWPPHSRRWRGYMPVISRIVQAVSRSIRAIRRTQPEATVLLCDNVENYSTRDPNLALEVGRRNLRRFLAMDLLTGRVDRHHPLHPWLTAYGMSELDLEWFRTHPQSPDVLGLDYYQNGDWQLENIGGGIRQRRSDGPAGIYGIGSIYYNRYGLPMMVTETSIDGKPINREIWLEQTIDDCRRLREEGIPLLGYFWWPLFDQVDWDGALTHRIGKIHEVGLFALRRQPDGTLARHATPLLKQFAEAIAAGDETVGPLDSIAEPADVEEQEPAIGVEPSAAAATPSKPTLVELPAAHPHTNGHGNGNGNGYGARLITPEPAAGLVTGRLAETAGAAANASAHSRQTDRYGIVVFSHLRWGFVWQRPQQFLSRFARKHRILFVEEPMFDLAADAEPRVDYHRVMPNVTVVTPRLALGWATDRRLPGLLRSFTKQAIAELNEDGAFDSPLLWYYSPMDASWSLGHFENRGIVYDCMDELSQFRGAPRSLVDNEARLIEASDVVFAGGYELGDAKRNRHDNVHTFGCGVEFDHFALAQAPDTIIPPDIDFMARPILGWFGVVDERVDYAMVGEMARLRPDWSFAMIGPVVKVDPNLLPHSPNLYWMGGRDYQQLPNYCKALDICMMPFAISAATQYINPTKALEYMATGRPVVGTPVRDVVRQWSNIVRIASTADEFVAAAAEALAARESGDPRVTRGIELAGQSSWEATVQQMQRLIAKAIGEKDRRSARPLPPAPQEQREYVYAHTQGS